MISVIDSLEEFNDRFINFNDPQKVDLFLPFDSMVNDALVNNRIEELRIILEDSDNSYSYYEDLYNLNYSPLTEEQYSSSTILVSSNHSLVYPYSKNNFIKQFFDDMLPSLSNHVLSYMKATSRIVQVGAGKGKGLIINPLSFKEDDLQFLKPLQYQSVIESMVNVTALLNNQQADIKFLLEQNQELKTNNTILSLEHQAMNNARVQDYLTTWR
jgi:hypothetical protein